VRGKDLFQQSFVGLAFHGKDDNTYEAVYLRPFNVRSDDPVRRDHAVQYMSVPDFDWRGSARNAPRSSRISSISRSFPPIGSGSGSSSMDRGFGYALGRSRRRRWTSASSGSLTEAWWPVGGEQQRSGLHEPDDHDGEISRRSREPPATKRTADK